MANSDPKQYYKSQLERDGGEAFLQAAADEFPQPIDLTVTPMSRRGFLAAAGFSFAGATAMMSGCERAPEEKAIPFLVQPEEITPGRAVHYATTCGGCNARCGMLAKNRDGRPIKLEGNPEHPIGKGGLCAIGQASLLDLYDSQRLSKGPKQDGAVVGWDVVDGEVKAKLDAIRANGGKVRVLTRSVSSPSMQRLVDEFLATFGDGAHIVHEPMSCSAVLDAHAQTHGRRVFPQYRFENARVIVSFDADFLGSWVSPAEYTAGWRAGRAAHDLAGSDEFSYHAHFESRYSVTGSKADDRVICAPHEIGNQMSALTAAIAKLAGEDFGDDDHGDAGGHSSQQIDEIAAKLYAARGQGLVVCGTQDVEAQVLCNYLNHLLGNYGQTLDISKPSKQRADDDAAFATLRAELAAGEVAALIMHGVNPVFDLADGAAFAAELGSNAGLVVSCAARVDETSTVATVICPDHHYLESWGDYEPVTGTFSLSQPTVAPLGKTRSVLESLAIWSGKPRTALAILREGWSDQGVWEKTLHDGIYVSGTQSLTGDSFRLDVVHPVSHARALAEGALSLVLYQKVGMRDAGNAGNPWLHEMPDPITKTVWDNYASLAPATAERMGYADGDVISLQLAAGGETVELPVLTQPGQHADVVAVALGYGAEASKRFDKIGPQWLESKPTVGAQNGMVGANAAMLITTAASGAVQYTGAAVHVQDMKRSHDLARTQDYHFITVPEHLAPSGFEKRPMIHELTAEEHAAGVEYPETDHFKDQKDMWADDHPYPKPGHHWGMVIDLTACTGCSGCTIACQAENNIPVVGKDEVGRNRDMYWMRIDRYYLEKEDGGVDTAHQPMMCHHCDSAPCETVCPVLATVHSDEGLNQQVYNRCVGTRYCANNCPYKVRRFNWFNYKHEDEKENLVLNPDVAVRTRGIMEKCSFCVQRIQEGKAEAKREGRELADGDVTPACQQSCPANAIVFGDMNDEESQVSKLIASGSHYQVLGEINIKPSVGYLNLIRNRPASQTEKKDH